jgi:SAM-dependent methyltransferase
VTRRETISFVSAAESHWNQVYADTDPRRVSWFEATPERSLEMIEDAGLSPDAAIIDAGGGASRLAAELAERGYRDLTVADISEAALEYARREMGEGADSVAWEVADLTEADLGREFDLWHDRAVLHFMVDPNDRDRYLTVLRRHLRPGGALIVAGFGPGGPTHCSGLPVRRYDEAELHAALGDEFSLLDSQIVEHATPSGNAQEFLYARFRRQH